jgi:ribonuclease Z
MRLLCATFALGLLLAATAQAALVRNLVLSHVTTQFDRPGVRERVIREVGEVYRGNIYFGEDLTEVPFTSPAASKLD